MSRPRRSRPQRWRTSEMLLVTLVATPFLLLAWAIVVSKQADQAMTERVATTFRDVDCVVLEVAVRPLTRVETIGGRKQSVPSGYDPIIAFEYIVAGQAHRSRRFSPVSRTLGEAEALAFLARYDEGTHHRCRVDPANPTLAFIAP